MRGLSLHLMKVYTPVSKCLRFVGFRELDEIRIGLFLCLIVGEPQFVRMAEGEINQPEERL
jgi:hypothetical protein